MNIDHIAENYGSHALRSSGLEPKKRAEEKKNTQAKPAVPSDQIQISDEAKAMKEKAGLLSVAHKALEEAPEPTLSDVQVRQVYARILNQHYDSRQVLESIAESLFNDGTQLAKQTADRVEASVPADLDALSPQRVHEIQTKIENGFYEQNEVFDVIVRELFS